MVKFKVVKTPLMDNRNKTFLKVGDVLERTVKEVEDFEKVHGESYLERVEEAPKKKEK